MITQTVITIYLCSHTKTEKQEREKGFAGPPKRSVRTARLCPKCYAAACDAQDEFSLDELELHADRMRADGQLPLTGYDEEPEHYDATDAFEMGRPTGPEDR